MRKLIIIALIALSVAGTAAVVSSMTHSNPDAQVHAQPSGD